MCVSLSVCLGWPWTPAWSPCFPTHSGAVPLVCLLPAAPPHPPQLIHPTSTQACLHFPGSPSSIAGTRSSRLVSGPPCPSLDLTCSSRGPVSFWWSRYLEAYIQAQAVLAAPGVPLLLVPDSGLKNMCMYKHTYICSHTDHPPPTGNKSSMLTSPSSVC